ncbi:ATPase, T2SS/T4P/T4SS family [Salinigranum sp.]|uniref:ATPase, T2SS/T4P/T4SS family n=1 Tax=Salinigranum sp. TaxID=1966351 RepID=UPI00356B3B8A
MAIDDADGAERAGEGTVDAEAEGDLSDPPAAVGEYTWADFLEEYGSDGEADSLYETRETRPGENRWDDDSGGTFVPGPADWDRVDTDPELYLGFPPEETEAHVGEAGRRARVLDDIFEEFCDPETTPVVKDEWMWEHYKREYYYEDDGSRPRSDGEIEEFDAESALGFDPDVIENAVARAGKRAEELSDVVDERTVDVTEDLDEDSFFTDELGATTVVNRYDLEKAVPMEKKLHFEEIERYWVNKPYAFVVIFHSRKENEQKYYVVQPYMNRIESDLKEYLEGKLRTSIKYSEQGLVRDEDGRRAVIENETLDLLERYDLYDGAERGGVLESILGLFNRGSTAEAETDGGATAETVDEGDGPTTESPEEPDASADEPDESGGLLDTVRSLFDGKDEEVESEDDGQSASRTTGSAHGPLAGISVRPEPVLLEENSDKLNEYQVEKLLYMLTRDFIGYERIDGIKHDINVEDISCDGYNSPVFVYHGDYEQIISNVEHGKEELDDFVVKLAQRSDKGISKRRPQVDATLPDGSRAQLTLGKEVSDHGTNYTIRQFKDVPFTPIDLINWKTFSLDEMAYLWLCIENNKSLIFAGGTASGKTTSLNAVSLFIPSNTKIVSIEDTREVELPQRNWIASVTRPSFTDDDKGDVDEFDLLEAALRQRPDYIVMGEIRGEEGRTLFQVMSTGHTTYTTFHADSVGEVLKRFTTEPINVSKTMFTALDLVSIQSSTRVEGQKVRRSKSITEINHYDPENDEINVQDVYQWQAETDEFLKIGSSSTLEEIKFDRGWKQDKLELELFKRQVVLAYLIDRRLNTYTQVAATFQAFINDPDSILTLMANDGLERSLEDLREMESVHINIAPEKEEMVPRPSPGEEVSELASDILERAEEELFPRYRGKEAEDVASLLLDVEEQPDVTAERSDRPELDAIADEVAELDGDAHPALGGGTADEGDDDLAEFLASASEAERDDSPGANDDLSDLFGADGDPWDDEESVEFGDDDWEGPLDADSKEELGGGLGDGDAEDAPAEPESESHGGGSAFGDESGSTGDDDANWDLDGGPEWDADDETGWEESLGRETGPDREQDSRPRADDDSDAERGLPPETADEGGREENRPAASEPAESAAKPDDGSTRPATLDPEDSLTPDDDAVTPDDDADRTGATDAADDSRRAPVDEAHAGDGEEQDAETDEDEDEDDTVDDGWAFGEFEGVDPDGEGGD